MALTPTKRGARPRMWAPVATGEAQGLLAISTAGRCLMSPAFSTI